MILLAENSLKINIKTTQAKTNQNTRNFDLYYGWTLD